MLIRIFSLFILTPIFVFSQYSDLDLERNISGVITTSEGVYLVLDEGLMQINKTDIYAEYYRKIYKDSTLVNPNTELKEDFNFSILPFLSPSINQQRMDFTNPVQLGVFVQIEHSNKYNLTPYGRELVDSLKFSE